MRIMFLVYFEDERLISFRYNIIMKFTLQCHYEIKFYELAETIVLSD